MMEFENKRYFSKGELSGDKDCSLNPPWIISGKYETTDHYTPNRRAWVGGASCVSHNSSVYVATTGDNFGADETPNNYFIIRKSDDGGNSWRTVSIFDHPDSIRMHEGVLWVDNENKLWFLWCQAYGWYDGRSGVWAAYVTGENEDGEPIWSTPKRLCHGTMAHPPITLKNGNIMLPVSIWKRYRSEHNFLPELEQSSVYISDDGLNSVKYVGGVDVNDSTFNENSIVELQDGSIYMTTRTSNAIVCNRSYDGGKTWTADEVVMPHTSSRTQTLNLGNGKYAMITNNNPKRRDNITVFLSTDECKTWTPKLLLDERHPTSYPNGHMDANGRFHIAYDFDRYVFAELYYATFTLDEVEKGEIYDPNSKLKVLAVKGFTGKATSNKIFEG